MESVINFFRKNTSAQWSFNLAGWMLVTILICVIVFFLGFPILSGFDIFGVYIILELVYVVIPIFATLFVLFSAIGIWLGIRGLISSKERTKSIASIIINSLIFVVGIYIAWSALPTALHGGPNLTSETSQVAPSTFHDQNCTIENIRVFSQNNTFITKCNKRDPIYEFITINGTKQKTYSTIDKVTTSPNGERIAYIGNIKNKDGNVDSYLVINGVEYKLSYTNATEVLDGETLNYAGFSLREILFSSDSKHIAYIIYSLPVGGNFQNIDVYEDGVILKKYDARRDCKKMECFFTVSDLQFSGNNKVAYILYRSESNAKSIVVDDTENKLLYKSMSRYAVSPDGSHIAYIGHESSYSYLIIDAKIFKSFPYTEEYSTPNLGFSDDGKTICYTRGTSQSPAYLGYKIVNSSEQEFPFDGMNGQSFSNFCNQPDSNIAIYRNKLYGFEFDYPSNWIVDESSDYPTIAAFHPKGSIEGAGVKLYYVKSFANFGTVKSLQELLQTVKGTYNTQPNLTFTTTGGFDAVIVSGLPGYVDNEEEAYVLLDNGILRIYPGEYIDSLRKILNK